MKITIPDKLYKDAEKIAGNLNISLEELFSRAIRKITANYNQREITEKLDKVYTNNDSRLDKEIIAMQNRTLLESENGNTPW